MSAHLPFVPSLLSNVCIDRNISSSWLDSFVSMKVLVNLTKDSVSTDNIPASIRTVIFLAVNIRRKLRKNIQQYIQREYNNKFLEEITINKRLLHTLMLTLY